MALKAVDAAKQTFDLLKQKAAGKGLRDHGTPDDTLLEALARQDGNILYHDPCEKVVSIEVGSGSPIGLAKILAGMGYKVGIDGVPYNY